MPTTTVQTVTVVPRGCGILSEVFAEAKDEVTQYRGLASVIYWRDGWVMRTYGPEGYTEDNVPEDEEYLTWARKHLRRACYTWMRHTEE